MSPLTPVTILFVLVHATGALPEGADPKSYHICSAHSPDYLGEFKFNDFQDGVSSYVNDEEIGLWRHKGFWYMGDYSSW